MEPLPGVPFDESSGHIPARDGRVLREGRPVPRLYAAGWAARPARGLIGHNKPDARAAVRAFLEDTATGSGAETP